MRTKFLLIIACFVFVSVAISSCLDSDTEYAYSSDATVHAFALDTIHGKKYKFEIDQIQRLIFNRDSLPMDADTLIDSILIDTFSVYGYITSGTPDTMLNIENAQNLLPAASGNGMTFRVYAPDNLTSRTYTLRINVHKEDPDSLSWVKMASAPIPALNLSGSSFGRLPFSGRLSMMSRYSSSERSSSFSLPVVPGLMTMYFS